MGIVIGIDPGKKGGCVALDESGRVVDFIAADHPDEGYVCGKDYLPAGMSRWLKDVSDDEVLLVIIEKQQARPMEGRSSTLTTGYGYGLWVGGVSALSLPYSVVSAGRWTKAITGAGKKDDRKALSIAHCQARLPSLPLTWGRRRKPHDGLADAGCLALYALTLIRSEMQ